MPVYEYHCLECNEHIELAMSVAEKSRKKSVRCPLCGSNDTKQVFSFMVGAGSRGGSSSRGSSSGCGSCSRSSCSGCH